jgi:hypothetical protein
LELNIRAAVAYSKWRIAMTARGRSQDRKRVAGGQDYEVRYEAKKTGKSKSRVKRAVKKVGNSRRKVERELRR